MKLGEALTVRRRQADKLNDLRGRIKTNVLVQEGDRPQENASELLAAFRELSLQHAELVRRINRTNIATQIGEPTNVTLAELLADREHLIRVRSVVSMAAEEASPSRTDYRFMRTEIRFVPAANTAELRNQIDELSDAINEYDLRIQEVNWQTDLL